MALLGYDGFEGISAADLGLRQWVGVSEGAVAGSVSVGAVGLNGQGVQLQNGITSNNFGAYRLYHPVPSPTSLVLGAAIRKSSFANSNAVLVLSLWEATVCHLSVTVDSLGVWRLHLGRSGTVLATSGVSNYVANTWAYIELEATIDNTTGFATLYLDGAELITFTGDTRNGGASGVITQFALDHGFVGGSLSQTTATFDDVVWLDTTGGAPYNAPLGPIRVDRLVPNADVAVDFTPQTAPDNWAMVDEALPDGDTSYVESATSGHQDVLGLQNLATVSGVIYAVQTRVRAKRTDAAAFSLIPSVISDSVEVDGATHALGVNYAEYSDLYPLNPDGDIPWVDASLNALTVAYRIP
jgi:hypothetical protein